MDYHRPAEARGHSRYRWLDSRHSFSFGHYVDPQHMGFSVLRVLNDDWVAPATGFPAHSHREMEILTYVREGSLVHADSLGNRFELHAGELQRMSAGRGIEHSEYNARAEHPLRFLQIWIEPAQRNLCPSYEQAVVPQQGALTVLVSPDGRDGSLTLHQDALLYRLQLAPGEAYTLQRGARVGYLHLIEGSADLGALALHPGDAAGIVTTPELALRAGTQGVTALWFDLPPA